MSSVHAVDSDIDVDLGTLFANIARNWLRILLTAMAVTAVALAIAWIVPPKYKAETRILIETRESIYTRPENNAESDRPILDKEGVASQVELITSADLLKQVALKLDLASRARRCSCRPDISGRIIRAWAFPYKERSQRSIEVVSQSCRRGRS